MWNHWTVRTSTPHEPFRQFEFASWTWTLLKEKFPEALSAVLMPNHIHLILPCENEKKVISKITGILSPISRQSQIQRLWQPIPPPSSIPDRHHLKRQIRYVALNPCRARLCKDPLEWYWSTYRDVMGASISPWVQSSQIAQVFQESQKDFRVRFHSYVSGDPSVAIEGTPAPQPAKPKVLPEESIIAILEAAAAALRLPHAEVRRKTSLRPLFVHLARHQGWKQTQVLSKICNVTPRAIQLLLKQDPPRELAAGALCLGDPRLRRKLNHSSNFAKREVNPGTAQG